jgi:hypothetical protein
MATTEAYVHTGSDFALNARVATTDTDTAASDLTYTVGAGSDLDDGRLYRDANASGTFDGGDTTIGVGGTFTQAEVAAGTIRYVHEGDTDDKLALSVSDGAGGQASGTVDIRHAPTFALLGVGIAAPDEAYAFDFSGLRAQRPADAPKPLAGSLLASDGVDLTNLLADLDAFVGSEALGLASEDPFCSVFDGSTLLYIGA